MSRHIKQICASHGRRRSLGEHTTPDYERVLTRWPPRSRCTPYDVLEQSRHGPYNKRRFHELVMVYHPDRWLHSTYHGIPKATRVQRYRMIVAANAILSDPIKRRAYDTHGVGWEADGPGTASRGNGDFASGNRPAPSHGVDAAGRPRPWQHNASRMNATWEDWESMRNGGPTVVQQALFCRNGYFAVLLVLISALSGVVLFAQASTQARRTAQTRDNVHRALLADLQDRRDWGACSERESLVEAFLLRRAAAAAMSGSEGGFGVFSSKEFMQQ